MLTVTQPADVLIADDEPIAREILQLYLENLGCRVHVAADGDEALARFRSGANWIDLVILDTQMPGLSSIPLYNRLRQIRLGVPIIFCSGLPPDDPEVYRISKFGMPLIAKPINRSDLFGAIRRAMRSARTGAAV